MIRWAIIMRKGLEVSITLYDSYTEALTEGKAVYETMEEKPDAFKIAVVRRKGKLISEMYVGYDVVEGKEYLSFNDILELSNMNMSRFSRAYGIPYRTVQNWANGQYLQIYMLSLLAIAVIANKENIKEDQE